MPTTTLPIQAREGLRSRPRAASESNPNFLRRITVNYIRHNLTDYDQKLVKISRLPGTKEAYEDIIRPLVEQAIDATYPELGAM